MSNRKKLTRTKLPLTAGQVADVRRVMEDKDRIGRRELRAMRPSVPVIAVLAPVLNSASSHQHNPSCEHYNEEI